VGEGRFISEERVNEAASQEQEQQRDLSVFVPATIRKTGEIGFTVLIIILGIGGYYFALNITSDSYSAPAIFPKMSSFIIAAGGFICLLKALRKKPPEKKTSLFSYLLPKDVLVMLLMLIVYCIALPKLHFAPCSFVFMAGGMIYLHRGKHIGRCMAISTLFLLVLISVFRYIFMVILP
jgi:membrane associated rhomboid family serine protease